MASGTPVLELAGARPLFDQGGLPQVALDLSLCPGDCVLIEARDARRAGALADLCSGLLPVADGEIRFLGQDWSVTPNLQAAALRGRIGRIHQRGAWADQIETHVNMMLPALHHTRRPESEVSAEALILGRRFGLPGLPVARPGLHTEADLVRAACVRAFLGRPALLLLEHPVPSTLPELMAPLLDAIVSATARGAAAICLIRDRAPWRGFAPFATRSLLLSDRGLVASGRRGEDATTRHIESDRKDPP